MCLGIPGRVVEAAAADDEMAEGVVEFSGVRRRVCLACVPDALAGEYVIVHAGIAISRVDAEEAAKVFRFLDASGELEGEAG